MVKKDMALASDLENKKEINEREKKFWGQIFEDFPNIKKKKNIQGPCLVCKTKHSKYLNL